MNTHDMTALVEAIQLAYPRIWFACHIEHRTRGEPHGSGLTDRETGVLAHIAAETAGDANASHLAKHLGIGKAALSQHLNRLQQLDLIEMRPAHDDRRRKTICLTAAGRRTVSDSSPLDADRIRRLLDTMGADDAADAVRGLQLLAEAAHRLQGAIDDARTNSNPPSNRR